MSYQIQDMPPAPPVGVPDLPRFARYCWHQRPYHTLVEIMDGLVPISPYGHKPGLWEAVSEALLEATGTKGEQLTGRLIAAALYPATYRESTQADVLTACKKAVGRADLWPISAKLAALAAACELGPDAEAGAWAYSLVLVSKHSATGAGGAAAPTGLPLAADEIALLLAGFDPETRLPLDEMDAELAIAGRIGRTPASMLLLSTVASASILSEQFAVARVKKALEVIPHRNRKVIAVMKAALEPAFEGLTIP